MLQDSLLGTIRTVVPVIISSCIALGLKYGFDLSAFQEALTVGATGLVTALYYFIATTLERRVNPAFGWLLGAPKAPAYTPSVEYVTIDMAGDEVTGVDPQG